MNKKILVWKINWIPFWAVVQATVQAKYIHKNNKAIPCMFIETFFKAILFQAILGLMSWASNQRII